MNKEQIGDIYIVYDEEGLGTLSLEFYELQVGDKKIDINNNLTDRDRKELSELLTKMNDIIVSGINKAIEEIIKED